MVHNSKKEVLCTKRNELFALFWFTEMPGQMKWGFWVGIVQEDLETCLEPGFAETGGAGPPGR